MNRIIVVSPVFCPQSFLTLRVVLTCALLLSAASVPLSRAATTIDTFPFWNGSDFIDSFGESNTATFGQTFRALVADSSLTSFTFKLGDTTGPIPVDFDAYVYAWDGAKANGPMLFSAGPFSTIPTNVPNSWETFTVHTGAVALIPGAQYVAFFSTSNRFDGILKTTDFAFLRPSFGDGKEDGVNAYPDGNFVFLNNQDDFGQITTVAWNNPAYYGGQPTDDLAFSMTFVPEPSSIALAAFGLAGVAVWGWSRRKR